MGSEQLNPTGPGPEPELHLLISDKQFEEPLYRSLFRELDEFFFPKKLPPLKLESKPAPVKDIWGFYNYKKNGALGSTGVHILLAGIIVGGTLIGRHVVVAGTRPQVTVTLIAPDELPALKPAKTQVGGGGGGVVKGKGPGLGPGEGGSTGGGIVRVGAGVSPPRVIYQPEPEFSEEARKAKFQGICTLALVVGADGRPSQIRVQSSLGMGLDEKAIEAVKNWKFEPAMKDGHPVPVAIAVEVDFHLY